MVAVAALVASVAVVALGMGACSGGSDDEPGLGTTAAPVPPTVPEPPAAPESGSGAVVLGRSTSTFEVTTCQLEPDADQPEGARTLVLLIGAGRTASGVAFTIEAQRFSTGTGAATTYTDTVTYSDAGRILQAQRIEVGGQVDDLRDPDASSPLLRPRTDGLSAAGLAGAPGDGAEAEGIVGLAVDATC